VAEIGDNFTQEFEPLAGNIGRLERQAGNVAPWSRKTAYEAHPNRVHSKGEYDRDCRGFLLCCSDCGA